MNRTLIAYFSCSGVTAQLAKELAAVTGGDLFEIEPAIPYTDADLDWRNVDARSTIEMRDKRSRPEIKHKVCDIKGYNIVYVGFPIWWYIAPTIVNTFLESYDFSGKTVIPFATSGGSGVGEADKWLQVSSKQANWKPAKRFGKPFRQEKLKEWVDSLQVESNHE